MDHPSTHDIDVPLNLAVLVGSSRKGRLGGKVADWFVQRASLHHLKLDVVDLAEITLPTQLEVTPEVRALAARVGAADAVVMITPEYNHGYPASLKLAIDLVRAEWSAKPVGFVSYGGLSGGLRAVEQLRLVCAELHMVSLRDVVSFHQAGGQFDENGRLAAPEAANAAAETLLERITWWARALRAARAAHPYTV